MRMAALIQARAGELACVTEPLPGSVAYDNVRPLNVPLRLDRTTALAFLCGIHANLDESFWRAECEAGRVTYKAMPVDANEVVRSGWRLEHHIPHTTEPDVSNHVRFLYEDDELLVVDKPAPLPMHPSGRFNRNTLIYFLKAVMKNQAVRIVHRLDANTTGVVVLAKTKAAAASLHQQFLTGAVNKTYLARATGAPAQKRFTCAAPVSRKPSTAGSRTIASIGEEGLEATTEFCVLERFVDGTTLIECRPLTGRTNQIRLHLAHLGFPIVGDPTYNAPGRAVTQSLSPDDAPMCLHAWRLEIQHPASKARTVFEAGAPAWSMSESLASSDGSNLRPA